MPGVYDDVANYSAILWFAYFKQPADARPGNPLETLQEIREYFFRCKWYEVYDFLEFTLNYYKSDELNAAINNVLVRELSGFHFLGGVFTDITDDQEVAVLEAALRYDDFPAVALQHPGPNFLQYLRYAPLVVRSQHILHKTIRLADR